VQLRLTWHCVCFANDPTESSVRGRRTKQAEWSDVAKAAPPLSRLSGKIIK